MVCLFVCVPIAEMRWGFCIFGNVNSELIKYLSNGTREKRAEKLHNRYKEYDKRNGFNPSETVSQEWILENILSPGRYCHYCGSSAWRYLGVDRNDSRKGHTPDNSICCCEECNRGKGEYTTEEFEQISKIKVYTSKTKKIMQDYQMTRIEDYLSLKNNYNRLTIEPHVLDIKRDMLRDLTDGKLRVDPFIQVEAVTREIIGGGHRWEAGKRLAEETGRIYPLRVVEIDLGGDIEAIRGYIESNESNIKKWTMKEHIEHYRHGEAYKKLKEFMAANGLDSYKVVQWVFGLSVKKVKNSHLEFSDAEYEVARKTIEWVRRAYSSIGKVAYSSNNAAILGQYRNLTVAVRDIYSGSERGTAKAKKTSLSNMEINDILTCSKDLSNGFMSFADIFNRLKPEAEQVAAKTGAKNVNASTWIETFYRFRDYAKSYDAKLKKSSQRPRLVAE